MKTATWFVVADGSRGRILAYDANEDTFEAVLPFEFKAGRERTRQRVTDRAGQTQERPRSGGHAEQKSQDGKEHDQEVLAREIADEIRSGRTDHRFDQLVLVAPPRFLGRLRDELDDASAAMVPTSHARDLTRLSNHELEPRLRELAPR